MPIPNPYFMHGKEPILIEEEFIRAWTPLMVFGSAWRQTLDGTPALQERRAERYRNEMQ